MKRRTIAALVGLLLLGAVPAVRAQTDATEMCVQNWEARGGPFRGGDLLEVCDFPANIHIPNLGTHSEGLHNNCDNGQLFGGSTWNNCISSIDYTNLPPNYRIQWYNDVNYGVPLVCKDADGSITGSYDLQGSNDRVSSFRVEGGSC